MLQLKLCLLFAGFFQGLLSIVFFYVQDKKKRENRVLVALFSSICLLHLIDLSFYFDISKNTALRYFSFLLFQRQTISLLVPSLFFLYFIKDTTKWSQNSIRIFLPIFLSVVIGIIAFFTTSPTHVLRAACHRDIWSNGYNYFFSIVEMGVIFQLWFLTKNDVLSQLINEENKQSGNQKKLLLVFFTGTTTLWVDNLMAILFKEQQHIQAYMYNFAQLLLLICFSALFLIDFKQYQMMAAVTNNISKYANSSLLTSQKELIVQKVKAHFETNESYLEQEYGLDHLASAIQTNRSHLSQTINELMGVSFTDLLHTYRVEACLKRFKEDIAEQTSIQQIYFECGFNSKSVFNTAFKKYTGVTPSEYRKKVAQHAYATHLSEQANFVSL